MTAPRPVRTTKAAVPKPPTAVDMAAELERANTLITAAEKERDAARNQLAQSRFEVARQAEQLEERDGLVALQKLTIEGLRKELAGAADLRERAVTEIRDRANAAAEEHREQLAEAADARDHAETELAQAEAELADARDRAEAKWEELRDALAEAGMTADAKLHKAAAALGSSFSRPKRLAVAHAEARGRADAYTQIKDMLP